MSLTLKEKVRTIIKLISEPKVLYALVSFRSFGYLLETGWFESFKSGEPVDAELKPIPWFTYSAIDFLKDKLNSNLNILEFGSGNSTLFFAERVKKVMSFEHNKDWYQKILKKIPANAELTMTSSLSAKVYLKPFGEELRFDVIIVDGLFRNECITVTGIYGPKARPFGPKTKKIMVWTPTTVTGKPIKGYKIVARKVRGQKAVKMFERTFSGEANKLAAHFDKQFKRQFGIR